MASTLHDQGMGPLNYFVFRTFPETASWPRSTPHPAFDRHEFTNDSLYCLIKNLLHSDFIVLQNNVCTTDPFIT